MSKVITYYLHVKDVMRNTVLALNYETKRELSDAYFRYKKDDDYEVLSMHSMEVSTDVLTEKDLIGGNNHDGRESHR